LDQKDSFLDIVQTFLKNDKVSLPVFSQTGLRIQQEIAKEDPDTRLIEKIICTDQALTTQVLRTANSAFFRGLNKVNSIREAIMRLGINEVSNIVSLSTQQANYRSNDPFIFNLMKNLWQHSVVCAVGSQWLARQLKFNNLITEAFTSGLLHDVGKLLVLKIIELIRQTKAVHVEPSETFVLEVLNVLHTEQGYLMSKSWNLPETYCNIIRSHHDKEFNVNDTLLVIVRIVDEACTKMGIGLSAEPDLSLETAPEANILGLNEIFLAQLEIQLEDSLIFSK
jgi:putative nucleotidyltransferase with HDIG domain